MKYRKKPVEIEAMQFDGSNFADILKMVPVRTVISLSIPHGTTLTIPTLEGEMTAQIGDYIIVGVQDEVYPCKPDIFEQTYEAV